MGFTPQQVGAMSLWQFHAAVNGYVAAHTPKDKQSLSDDEAEELYNWITEPNGNRR